MIELYWRNKATKNQRDIPVNQYMRIAGDIRVDHVDQNANNVIKKRLRLYTGTRMRSRDVTGKKTSKSF